MSAEEYQQEFLLNKIRSQKQVDEIQLSQQLQEMKTSIIQNKSHSSLRTIMSCSNSMVGTSCLVFPLVFQQAGLITSTFSMLILAMISNKTCQLLFVHIKDSEMDINESIRRVLGERYYISYMISSVCFMLIGCLIYYQLGCLCVYQLLQCLAPFISIHLPTPSHFTYSTFSYQWLGLLYTLSFFILLLKHDLKFLIKLSAVGLIAILFYICFLTAFAIQNIPRIQQSTPSPLVLFSWDCWNSLGVFSVSFFVHSYVVPIFRASRAQEHVQRDLSISFVLTCVIYGLMGVVGGVAIAGRTAVNPQTSLDYFIQYPITALLLFFLALQLFISTPLLFYCTKSLFFHSIYSNHLPITQTQYILANSFFLFIATLLQQFNANISTIISLAGAVFGWWLIYVIPIMLHMNCLYKKGQQVEHSMEQEYSLLKRTSSECSITDKQYLIVDKQYKINKDDQQYKECKINDQQYKECKVNDQQYKINKECKINDKQQSLLVDEQCSC